MIKHLNNLTVYFHESPKTLPAERHKDFNVYLSHEKDIGSDFEAIKKRANEALMYFSSDAKAAKSAIMNIYFTADAIMKGMSFNGRALALLVDKYVIDGKEVRPGYSDEDLDHTIKILSDHGFTQNDVESLVSELKKK